MQLYIPAGNLQAIMHSAKVNDTSFSEKMLSSRQKWHVMRHTINPWVDEENLKRKRWPLSQIKLSNSKVLEWPAGIWGKWIGTRFMQHNKANQTLMHLITLKPCASHTLTFLWSSREAFQANESIVICLTLVHMNRE